MDSEVKFHNMGNPHSPLPWEFIPGSLVLLDPYGNVTADCEVETYECEREPNTLLIAVACNNHYTISEALFRLTEIASVMCNLKKEKSSAREDVWMELDAAVTLARAAINQLKNYKSKLSCAKPLDSVD